MSENVRQSAYWILGLVVDNPAEFWHTTKMPRLGKDPMTLEDMPPDQALWVVKGMWQKHVLGRDTGPFFTSHRGEGPKDLDE